MFAELPPPPLHPATTRPAATSTPVSAAHRDLLLRPCVSSIGLPPRRCPRGSFRGRRDIPATRAAWALRMSSRPRHHGAVRVLVVEDHPVLVQHLAEGLRDRGIAVDVALDGGQALETAAVTKYDVVVLDRDLPG